MITRSDREELPGGENMNIAVLGAGNAGFAFSGHLSLLGYRVTLYENEKFKGSLGQVAQSGRIKLIGQFEAEANLYEVTTNMEEAVKDAKIVIIPVPAFAQESMFNSYLKFAEEGQVVIFFPGNYAGLRFYKTLIENRINDFITIAESDTIPYAARKTRDSEVDILGIKNKLYFSAIPSSKTGKNLQLLNNIFNGIFAEAPNVLFTSLNNSNCTAHCPASVLNAGWIETSGGRFSFFGEGMSPSVCRVIEDVDKEQVKLGSFLGMRIISEKDFYYEYYGIKKCETLHEIIQLSQIHKSTKAPATLKDRYITEDVPFGLVPIATLSKQFGLKTPTIDSIIHLANVLNGENYYKMGITPSKLGIDGLSKDKLLKFVNEGERY